MSFNETVSVVIPFFNSADTLERALSSVQNQTHPVLEVIVVDDASDPSQYRAADQIIKCFPSVRLLHLERNGGPAVARNRGIEVCLGSLVAFLDSDDYWLPDKIDRVLQVMREQNVDFIGHSNIIAGERRPTINDRLRPEMSLYRMARLDVYITTSQFAPTTVVFRKDQVPVRFDESIRRSEDYRLWGDLIFRGYGLWKLKEFLSVREEPNIKGMGLSGNVEQLLKAHLETMNYFNAAGYVSYPTCILMKQFLRAKYLRHL